MSGHIVADRLTKCYRVKSRVPGLRGALRALIRPRYRDIRAVQDVSFRVEPGDVVAFLGPNGSGKTTTLKMLSGLLYPTSGRADVAGLSPWNAGAAFKQRIAVVLGSKQQLVWDLPPVETFLLNQAIYNVSTADFRERLAELVTLLELADLINQPTRQLSLGERMKCELAAALLHAPDILFLDEPTLGLDVSAQDAIHRFLRAYRERHGATILLTSHYMADVTALASRVLVINRGRLLHDGSLRDLVAKVHPVKRVDIVLAREVALSDLEAFGSVSHFQFPNAVLEVPREHVGVVSAGLLARLPVMDLSIYDQPIETAVLNIYSALIEPAESAHGTGDRHDDERPTDADRTR